MSFRENHVISRKLVFQFTLNGASVEVARRFIVQIRCSQIAVSICFLRDIRRDSNRVKNQQGMREGFKFVIRNWRLLTDFYGTSGSGSNDDNESTKDDRKVSGTRMSADAGVDDGILLNIKSQGRTRKVKK